MSRLSDLIKSGKLPEKQEDKGIRLSTLQELRSPKEDIIEIIEEKKPKSEVVGEMDLPTESDDINEMDLPTEAKEEVSVVDQGIALEKIALPSEEDDPVFSKEELSERERIDGLYVITYEFLKGIERNLRKKQKFSIEKGLELVGNIIDSGKSIQILFGKAVQCKDIPDDILSHSVNVCIYAIMLGIGFGFTRNRLVELGIAALLHDMGMLFIPNEILKKSGKLTAKEMEIIKKHPYYTYKILLTLEKKHAWIAEIAYQEQEREGGQGYPRGLKGDEIHDFAKIIGIVDVYEAMTHPRPQRKSHMPHEAVKLILGTQKDHFSNETKRILLKKLSCFPVNSYARLNSKAIGKVIEVNEDSPLRPTIEILFDSQNRKLSKRKIVRLEEVPLLFITKTINENDLPK